MVTWLVYDILWFLLPITIATNTGLPTQQGIIYGRQTQNSIEYLGYNFTFKCSRSVFVIFV